MRVLRPDNKRKDYKLVGASMPPQAYHYLNLYILAKKTTKTIVLTTLVNEWTKKQRVVDSENSLIIELAERVEKEWKSRDPNERFLSFDLFEKDVIKELTEKGLSAGVIKAVLVKLKQDAENKKHRGAIK